MCYVSVSLNRDFVKVLSRRYVGMMEVWRCGMIRFVVLGEMGWTQLRIPGMWLVVCYHGSVGMVVAYVHG